MHNASLLKHWGPFPALSEFAGERMNGMLQKIKTNKKMEDMPLTMLRQMARRGRLEAQLSDGQLKAGALGQFSEILQPTIAASRKQAKPLSDLAVAKILKVSKELPEEDYELLLQYQRSKGQPWRSWLDLPQPHGALILPPAVLYSRHFKIGDHTFSRIKSRKKNSRIQFKDPEDSTTRCTGYIREIWQIPVHNYLQTFFLVEKYKPLALGAIQKTPYHSLNLFQATAVSTDPSNNFCIIEPHHILTHLTSYYRPKGTFGILKAILVICWALNRGRRA
ncbi:hypothetical protein R3P38DRAFT_2546681 [Favolaschia claudopus]|uniref:Ribosomal protein S4 n=1 Tax=Favolaschia claudopus TaxID=2862362 RepID=A0AAW0AJI8_9AGAR